ncbi:MAG: TIGR01777 family oxidoreductase [Wenzhouxiangellaceae bacterium]
MMTDALWALLAVQAVLGAFDIVYHHEFMERLAWRRSQRSELVLHGWRNAIYALLFLCFAWLDVQGWWAGLLLALLLTEVVLTLVDFVEEDRSRALPASERVTHGLLALNYGIFLGLLLPVLWPRLLQTTQIGWVSYSFISPLVTLAAVGVSVFALRDWLAARRMARWVTAPAAELVAALPQQQRILITGATGFIGYRLTTALVEARHQVTVLARNPQSAVRLASPLRIVTELTQIDDDEVFDIVINLAGEPIANGWWTRAKRLRIIQSRLRVTQAVVSLIARLQQRPRLLISGSAVGWYGLRDARVLTEADGHTPCFSHQLCAAWERTANSARRLGVRVVCLRIGLVLGRDGGMLSRLLVPYEFGLGGRLGDGEQMMSWIERDDLIRLIAHCIITPNLSGPVNASAPQPVTNVQFTQSLAAALKRPALLHTPAWLLRLVGGDLARELLLGGQSVVPRQAMGSGIEFRYPLLPMALRHIIDSPPRARPDNKLLTASVTAKDPATNSAGRWPAGPSTSSQASA